MTIEIKVIEQYLPVLLFVMRLERRSFFFSRGTSLDDILKYDNSKLLNNTFLWCCLVCCQGGSNRLSYLSLWMKFFPQCLTMHSKAMIAQHQAYSTFLRYCLLC